MCLHPRLLFEKFKNLNLNRTSQYDFGIKHVNIQDRLEILNFEFQKSKNKKQIWDSEQLQIKKSQL